MWPGRHEASLSLFRENPSQMCSSAASKFLNVLNVRPPVRAQSVARLFRRTGVSAVVDSLRWRFRHCSLADGPRMKGRDSHKALIISIELLMSNDREVKKSSEETMVEEESVIPSSFLPNYFSSSDLQRLCLGAPSRHCPLSNLSPMNRIEPTQRLSIRMYLCEARRQRSS